MRAKKQARLPLPQGTGGAAGAPANELAKTPARLRPRSRNAAACARRQARAPARLRLLLPGLALAALAGCAGGGPPGGAILPTAPEPAAVSRGAPSAPPAAADPRRVVADFLDAAARRDHGAMALLFGSGGGPIAERGGALGCGLRRMGSWFGLGDRCLTAQDVELRMDVMAAILAHETYRVGARETVAGRGRVAVRFEVRVDTAARRGVAVPFVVVRADDGRWLVEEVGLDRLTG